MMSTLSPEERSEIMLSNITGSDCGVIAFQAITGMDRVESERLCREAGDYQDGEGISRYGMQLALRRVGYKAEPVYVSRETTAVFSLGHEYGTYLLFTDGHVMALIDGDLYNGRTEGRAPVEEAFRITAPNRL
jgi:hypothetical protein